MAGGRTPGPTCQINDPVGLEDGTMCRAASPLPGFVQHRTASTAAQRSARNPLRDVVVGGFLECLPPGGMARRFVSHYAYRNGERWRLSNEEMAACNAAIDLYADDHPQFLAHVARMRDAHIESEHVTFAGWPRAMTVGTLGGFTSRYEGVISFDREGFAQFEGTMHWTDRWDFEPHTAAQQNAPSGRGQSGERLAWAGRNMLPGTPFDITSETVRCSQRHTDRWLQWYGSTPLHPPRWVDARCTTLLGAEGVIAGGAGSSALRAVRSAFQRSR